MAITTPQGAQASAANRPARAAAIVNGLLIFGVPAGFMIADLAGAGSRDRPDYLAAYAPSPRQVLVEWVGLFLIFLVLGAVAAWRTWVHAIQYQTGATGGWQGVREAAAVGFAGAVAYLLPGIVTRPTEAPPYVVFYGSIAALFGALIGVLLLFTARLTLRLSRSARTEGA